MTPALNEHCFSKPHWRVIASGFDAETWFESEQGTGTGGIFNPRAVHLPVGHYYYRFVSRTSKPEFQSGGGWWLDYENYRKVEEFASANSYSLRMAARLTLALPYDWTRVDRLIKVLLKQPLKAYAGEGKPARGGDNTSDHGTRWIPTQHVKVRQLYIPGLYVKGERPRQQLYELAFKWPAEIRIVQ